MFNEKNITGAVVLAVSVDSIENLGKTRSRLSKDTKIILLSDPGHKIIDQYGLLNPKSPGLPHPATYVIDKKGVVRWKFVETDYTKRPDNEEVLKALKSIGSD
jgi:peroxiredoxin